VVAAIAGLLILTRRDRALAFAGLATFTSQWLLLAILERWFWGGASFGQRRFDSCALFFILGLAALLERLPAWLGALVTIPTTGWTMLLFTAVPHLNLNRYQTPAELVHAVRAGLADPAWHSVLGYTPPALREKVTGAALAAMVAAAVVVFAARRAPALSAAVYLTIMTTFYAWCGFRQNPMAGGWPAGPTTAGAAADTVTLLRYEADYFARTGRPAQAGKALAEAQAIAP
jgi:hypothetical protein